MKKIVFLIFIILLSLSCLSKGDMVSKNEILQPKIDNTNLRIVKDKDKKILISIDEKDPFLVLPKFEPVNKTNFKKENNDKKIILSKDFDFIVKIVKQKDYLNKKNKNNITGGRTNINIHTDTLKSDNLIYSDYTDYINDNIQLNPKKSNIEEKKFDLTNIDNLKIIEKEQQEIIGEENKTLKISIQNPGWIIKSITPEIIQLIKRENMLTNTLFEFFLSNIGEVSIVFINFNEKDNTLIRQPYKIVIRPKELIIKENNKNEKQSELKKSKIQKEEEPKKELANKLFDQKRFEEAFQIYNELIKEGKGEPEIFYKIGKIYLVKENFNDAKSNFLENLKDKENIYYNDSLIELINILKKEKKYSEAINSYFKYWKEENKNPKIDMLLAGIYFEMKDYNTSANEYRRYLAKYPDSEFEDVALFYLAYSIENYKENPDFKEAYRLYKLLISKYPESIYYDKSKNRMLYLERHYLKIN